MESINDSVIGTIQLLSQQKENLLIAIDGRCAAGKTTLAARLRESLSCNIVPMDHFFLRPEQRTPERLREPGGNVDYERFLEEVLIPLKQGGDFAYRPYDCRTQAYGDAILVQFHAVTVIEGSYSCHPELRGYYDLRVFLTVDPKTQLQRIQGRNGESGMALFREKWIPLEEAYFTECNVREHCDLRYISQ